MAVARPLEGQDDGIHALQPGVVAGRPLPALLAYLNGKGIDAKTHYSIAIHQQEGYPWGKDAEIRGSLANAEKNAASCISLPIYAELTAEEVDYVIEAVRSWKK